MLPSPAAGMAGARAFSTIDPVQGRSVGIERALSRLMRLSLVLMLTPLVAGCPSEGPYTISGSARLPECTETPGRDLTGRWYDQGMLTVSSAGCEASQAPLGAIFVTCPLNWEMTQDGNAVNILVDSEYRMQGQMCGDTLHLQGGWWLPLVDENGQCNYDDDDGAEVGIEAGGSSLLLTEEAGDESFTGTLSLRERCTADYAIQLRPL